MKLNTTRAEEGNAKDCITVWLKVYTSDSAPPSTSTTRRITGPSSTPVVITADGESRIHAQCWLSRSSTHASTVASTGSEGSWNEWKRRISLEYSVGSFTTTEYTAEREDAL